MSASLFDGCILRDSLYVRVFESHEILVVELFVDSEAFELVVGEAFELITGEGDTIDYGIDVLDSLAAEVLNTLLHLEIVLSLRSRGQSRAVLLERGEHLLDIYLSLIHI